MQFEHFTSKSIIGFAASQNLTFTHAGNIVCAILRKLWFDTDAEMCLGLLSVFELLKWWRWAVLGEYSSSCGLFVCLFLFYAWHPIILRDSYPDFHFVCSTYFYKVWLGKLRFERVALEHNQSSKILTAIRIFWETSFY